MKNKTKSIALSIVLTLAITLLLPIFAPVISYATDDVIYISSAEELVEFAKSCSYDSWSQGKKFALKNDISLEGVSFEPAASFSGSFDGRGHKISGLSVSGAYSPAGLFSTLTVDAVVTNLSVSGVISPDGDKGYVGGIVGINYGKIEGCSFNGTVVGKNDVGGIAGVNKLSGTVNDCSASGEIIGENRTGGVVGFNEGAISASENNAKVNNVSLDSSLSLEDLNLSLTLDLTKLPSFSTSNINDAGGIAGYSTGIIMGCTNNASVGYPHVGYNIGGIVGRSSGHLSSNVNNGVINGRKDVGGIVGQIEPYVSYDLSEDFLLALKSELDSLSQVVEEALGSADSSLPTVSSRLDKILTNLDYATDSLNLLINDVTDFGNGFIGEVNRIGEILSQVVSDISDVMAEAPELTRLLEASLIHLKSALANLEDFAKATEGAISDISSASDSASKSFDKIGSAVNNLSSALSKFENSIKINDRAEAKKSLELIADSLGELTVGFDNFTTALNLVIDVLENNSWADETIAQLESAVEIFTRLYESANTIYEAVEIIKGNVDIHWDKIVESSDELIAFIGHFTDMAQSLGQSILLMESGLSDISLGFAKINNAIEGENIDEIRSGLELVESGFDQITEATDKGSLSLEKLGELLQGFDKDKLDEFMPGLADALVEMSDALGETTDGFKTLSDGIRKIISNIKIDVDEMKEGGALIILGIDDITESVGYIGDAVVSFGEAMTSFENAVIALKEAIEIDDEGKISAALDDMFNEIGEMISAGGDIAELLTDMTDTLKEAKVWGNELINAFGSVAEALSDISGALVKIQSGIDALRDNISFDLDSAKEGLQLIYDGLDDLSDASYLIGDCFGHLSDALDKFDSGSGYLSAAITDFKEMVYTMSVAMDILNDMSMGINRLVGYLKEVDPICFPTVSENTTNTANQLFAYISAIESELKYLNGDLTGLSDEMIDSLSRMNAIFTNISDNIVDSIYELDNKTLIETEVSEEEIDSVTQGKIFSCVNNAQVSGDKNVGGIGGSMGLEFALDPEDDFTSELSLTQKKQYKMKAVIHACINNGNVTAKKDNAGGIVGKMDLGLIYGSESYCEVVSESGNYVGGIAGVTSGLISQCFAKCSLSGNKYIGGIVGSGTTETISGGSSMVRNCYSMVYINKYTQYAGAISGVNSGEYSENLFVSSVLSGIDRVSYGGKAEPITYEDLIKRRSIPDGFYSFILEFVADGEILHSVSFEYGASFDSSVFPEIPLKDGYYGYWDKTNLTGLVFDTTVSVVYKPYVTSLGSEEKREDGREIFFVEGEFIEGDGISVQNGCDTSSLILEDKLFTKYTLKESFTLIIPEDNLDVNRIHFLPKNSGSRVFVKMGGAWYDVNAKEFGSYLLFSAEGEKIEIAIVEESIKLVPVIAIAVSALILVVGAIIIVLVSKKKRAKANAKNQEKSDKTDKK